MKPNQKKTGVKKKKLLFYTQLANIETNKSEQRREKKLKIAKCLCK